MPENQVDIAFFFWLLRTLGDEIVNNSVTDYANIRTYGRMDVWTYGRMDVWTYGRMDVRMFDVWMRVIDGAFRSSRYTRPPCRTATRSRDAISELSYMALFARFDPLQKNTHHFAVKRILKHAVFVACVHIRVIVDLDDATAVTHLFDVHAV
jgi:hypothetical protein